MNCNKSLWKLIQHHLKKLNESWMHAQREEMRLQHQQTNHHALRVVSSWFMYAAECDDFREAMAIEHWGDGTPRIIDGTTPHKASDCNRRAPGGGVACVW
mmetsp:Transcript_1616/g.3537  ORF Transcript_1616/g.3537 Transcript_1616/m.3537 type:complete len:100 (+) Transcript_1616:1243-1542(+)